MNKTKVALFAGVGPPRERVARPFLKWAGGKAQLWEEIRHNIPSSYFHYYEPFLGGGAVFFALNPPEATLADKNEELIITYVAVRDELDKVIRELRKHEKRNSSEHFYKVRGQAPQTLLGYQRAARLIYLNKTCFNGLYRVNSRGDFNVPYGTYKNPRICDDDSLRAASRCLQGKTIRAADYRSAVSKAKKHDLIYFDPPYHPISDTSSFTGYQANGFGEASQRDLAELFFELHARGCYVLLSNSTASLIYGLYEDHKGVSVRTVRANRAINSKANGRGKIEELLISNF